MTDQKLTDLTEELDVADDDLLYVVDVSDTTDSPNGTSKKIKRFILSGLSGTYKKASTSRSNTTTLADDPDLSVPLTAGDYFKIEAYIIASAASNTPDIQWRFAYSQAAVSDEYRWTIVDSQGGLEQDDGNLTDTFSQALFVGESYDFHFIGYIETNATTAGTLTLQWAQNSLSGDATTVGKGSWLEVTRLGKA